MKIISEREVEAGKYFDGRSFVYMLDNGKEVSEDQLMDMQRNKIDPHYVDCEKLYGMSKEKMYDAVRDFLGYTWYGTYD